MRYLAWLCVVALLGLSSVASATPFEAIRAHRGSGLCANDGSAGAPAGTPLYAARRAAWAFPPVCQVTDVDFNVGPDPSATLRNPETATLPSGVSWNATEHRIECAGAADGTIIQNLDTSLVSGGSGAILINGCSHVVIRNVKLTNNCNDPAHAQVATLRQLSGAGNTGISIEKVTIDRGGLSGASCGSGEAIYLDGPGLQSITYTRVINADQHSVTFLCETGSVCTAYARYNSFSRAGYGQGQHANIFQFLGERAGTEISYNYFGSPQPDTSSGAIFTVATTASNATATLTLGAPGSQTSLLDGMTLSSANIPGGTTFTNPSQDPTSPLTLTLSANATATASGTAATVPNAYPFGTAGMIRYVNQGTTAYLNGVFVGNVFDSTTPILPATYAFVCQGGSTSVDVTSFTGNYINLPGFQGGLWSQAGTCNITSATGNKNLATGATISVP